MNKQIECLNVLKLIKDIRRLRAKGMEYKDIDLHLNLPTWTCPVSGLPETFSYKLLKMCN